MAGPRDKVQVVQGEERGVREIGKKRAGTRAKRDSERAIIQNGREKLEPDGLSL